MGLIREPKGVDLIVGPSAFTKEDRKMISDIIADYKRTGKVPRKVKRTPLRGMKSSRKERVNDLMKQIHSSLPTVRKKKKN